jgi:hypothetical protein
MPLSAFLLSPVQRVTKVSDIRGVSVMKCFVSSDHCLYLPMREREREKGKEREREREREREKKKRESLSSVLF